MAETLRINPDGLDLKQNHRDEILHSLGERIGVAFTSEEMAKAYFAESMGSDLHEAWRKLWREQHGNEPRNKTTKDQEWAEKHGTFIVDIASTKFEDLPSDYKHENLEAAKVAIELVFDKVVKGEEITDEMIEEMASIVHDERLKRNSWVFDKESGNPVLAVKYIELPEEEKEKDRAQVRQAMTKIKGGK